VSDVQRYAAERDNHPREALLVEPRRWWRACFGAAALFLGGGIAGVTLAVELLAGEVPPRSPATRPGAEVLNLPARSMTPERLRQEAERLQATAELAALRQEALAERARLEQLLRDRRDAETAVVAPQEAVLAELVVAETAPARFAEAPAPPAPSPAEEEMVSPAPASGPPRAPRPAVRGRGDARADSGPEVRGNRRVLLHYLAGSPAGRQAAEDAAAVLRDARMEGVEFYAVANVPDSRLVRYHRAEDAGAAARLAGRLGRGWALQDSRGYDPGGNGHSLEIWLPDR
jgi:hypothetical protein